MLSQQRFLGLAALIAACGVVSVVGPGVDGSRAAEPAKAAKPDWSKFNYETVGKCAGCHTQPTNQRIEDGALELVLLSEAGIWRTYDKHAQAYAVLEGERGRMIGRLLGLKEGDILKPEAGCLSCHAMNNLSKENLAHGKPSLSVEDGVSCGGCHGPSSEWLGPHIDKKTWREKSAQAKLEKGMRDLRDPERRAEVCVSCHVGNAAEGKVVTHAMFAAGHPPLPSFEIVNFSRNEPQHWRDPVDVPYFKTEKKEIIENYHLENKKFFQTQFALIGAVVAFRENLRLSYDRADPNPSQPDSVWPELLMDDRSFREVKPDAMKAELPSRWSELAMAHSDCFACHHDLKFPGYRQARGFGYYLPGHELIRVSPGRPLLRSWPLAPLVAASKFTGKTERIAELHKLLKNLAAACNDRPFGKPEDIRTAAGALVAWSDQVVADLRAATYSEATVRGLIKDLAGAFQPAAGSSNYPPDYETARLLVSIMRAAYGDLERTLGPAWTEKAASASKTVRNELVQRLNLEPYSGRDQRLAAVLNMIETSSRGDDKSDPKMLEGLNKFQTYLKDIRQEDQLKGLVKNSFLTYLDRDYTSKTFVDGIKKKAMVDKLQEIGDKEEDQTLKAVSGYDPAVIGPLVQEFAKIISEK